MERECSWQGQFYDSGRGKGQENDRETERESECPAAIWGRLLWLVTKRSAAWEWFTSWSTLHSQHMLPHVMLLMILPPNRDRKCPKKTVRKLYYQSLQPNVEKPAVKRGRPLAVNTPTPTPTVPRSAKTMRRLSTHLLNFLPRFSIVQWTWGMDFKPWSWLLHIRKKRSDATSNFLNDDDEDPIFFQAHLVDWWIYLHS